MSNVKQSLQSTLKELRDGGALEADALMGCLELCQTEIELTIFSALVVAIADRMERA